MCNLKSLVAICLSFFSVAILSLVHAGEVNIAKGLPYVNTVHNGKLVKIERNQDQSHVLTGAYTKTSRKCPPFCVQPIQVAPGVVTVGELELLEFIQKKVNKGQGVLIDARTPSWFEKSTIPGSINIPFNTFDPDSSDLVKVNALAKLGVIPKTRAEEVSLIDQMMSLISDESIEVDSKWDFSGAKEVMLWCNGMWCGQSPRAIKGMLVLGYPASKIYYYRGGMQSWQSLGLTIVTASGK